MAVTRVKIPRLVLIERIQERIDKETAEYEAAVADYKKQVEEFMTALPKELERIASELSKLKGDALHEQYDLLDVGKGLKDVVIASIRIKGLKKPTFAKPTKYEHFDGRGYTRYGFDSYMEQMKQTKRVLEASNEETISVSTNDRYAQFL